MYLFNFNHKLLLTLMLLTQVLAQMNLAGSMTATSSSQWNDADDLTRITEGVVTACYSTDPSHACYIDPLEPLPHVFATDPTNYQTETNWVRIDLT